MDDKQGIAIALEEAKLSYAEGGIPVYAYTPSPPQKNKNKK